MPIYEYRCNTCSHKISQFVRNPLNISQPICTHCGSNAMVRLMSTFSVRVPWDAGTNLPSSETLGDFDENDPKSTADWVKGMRRDMGDSFGKDAMG